MGAAIVATLPAGSAKPTGGAQFGSRFFLAFEDLRPYVIKASGQDGSLKAIPAGIKAPTTAPTLAASATPAGSLLAGDTLYVAYAFYSSSRVTWSQMSPAASITVPSPAKQITVSAFEAPRDNAATCEIDQIGVFIQMGLNAGLMGLFPANMIDASDGQFASKTFTIDLSADDLELGWSATEADQYYALPPAVRYLEQYGERLWLGGQRKSVTIASSGVTVTASVSWRGSSVAKLVLTGSGVFDDSLHYHSAYVNGQYLGEVWDVDDAGTLYLDRAAPGAIAQTQNFFFAGHNDRVWPTSHHVFNPGNMPVAYPESVSLLDYVALAPVLDRGEELRGIKRMRDTLELIFSDTAIQLAGGFEVGAPLPELRIDWGRAGTMAPRSICADGAGSLAWVGEEGVCIGNTAGVASIAMQLGCRLLFKGGRWIAPSDLPGIVMTYSRAMEGYIFGNLSINGEACWWGLLALAPQQGFWLFSGQEITSNILEYPDANGQGVILAGDSCNGRVKRLLDPSTLLDVQSGSDTPAAFTWRAREGWAAAPDGQLASPARLRLLGLVAPAGALTLAGSLWRSNFAQRDEADLAASDKLALSVTESDLLRDIPLPTGAARYHSLELSGASNIGATGARGVEVCRWQLIFAAEGRR